MQVQVNLSHDIKDPKSVIFSMISLLRDRYIETFKSYLVLLIAQGLDVSLIFYVRIMLKLGLLQERRVIYDTATAVYYQTIETIKQVLAKTQSQFLADNLEQLNLLIQPYLCLAFLHAKQDHSTDKANYFMAEALNLISQIIGEDKAKGENPSGTEKSSEQTTPSQSLIISTPLSEKKQAASLSQKKLSEKTAKVDTCLGREKMLAGCETPAQKSGLVYKHQVRWAEMWMMHSQFHHAIYQYLCALKSLCDCKPFERDETHALTLSDLGTILAGLEEIGVTEEGFLRWVSPPLTQLVIVLGH